MSERVIERTASVYDTISRNKMPLFSQPPLTDSSNPKQSRKFLKSDCALFLRLYIASQTRDGDLDNFF